MIRDRDRTAGQEANCTLRSMTAVHVEHAWARVHHPQFPERRHRLLCSMYSHKVSNRQMHIFLAIHALHQMMDRLAYPKFEPLQLLLVVTEAARNPHFHAHSHA